MYAAPHLERWTPRNDSSFLIKKVPTKPFSIQPSVFCGKRKLKTRKSPRPIVAPITVGSLSSARGRVDVYFQSHTSLLVMSMKPFENWNGRSSKGQLVVSLLRLRLRKSHMDTQTTICCGPKPK